MYTARNITFWHKGATDLGTAHNSKNLFAFHLAEICSFDSAVPARYFTVDNSGMFGLEFRNSGIFSLEFRHCINVKIKSILELI